MCLQIFTNSKYIMPHLLIWTYCNLMYVSLWHLSVKSFTLRQRVSVSLCWGGFVLKQTQRRAELNREDTVSANVSLICINLRRDFDVQLICEERFTNDLRSIWRSHLIVLQCPAGKELLYFHISPRRSKILRTALMVKWSQGQVAGSEQLWPSRSTWILPLQLETGCLTVWKV